MRLHGPEYQLPNRITRIIVIGVTGSGKTTLCQRIAESRGIEHTELDSLFHGENWEPRPTFVDDVHDLVARDNWITEYQYKAARPIIIERTQPRSGIGRTATQSPFRDHPTGKCQETSVGSKCRCDKWIEFGYLPLCPFKGWWP